jgi:hypothetical protein
VGVDDWAWRKGSTYGTIIVDLERREVLDLFPERAAGMTERAVTPAVYQISNGCWRNGAIRNAKPQGPH